jgi:hypothetical protein
MTLFGHDIRCFYSTFRKNGKTSTSFVGKQTGSGITTLAQILPGKRAEVIAFLTGLPRDRQAHLLAYGLAPGSTVSVSQHKPVTVIQVDNIELAIENELAGFIQVG